jgi:hypothetical protein
VLLFIYVNNLDAIESYYDQSPETSPPNGYRSPNPSPPNGFHSPNPTPPNGYLANNSPAVYHQGIQGIVNPPITFYGEDAVMGYDEDQFMKTMRILTTSYNDPPQPPQQYDHMDPATAITPSRLEKMPSATNKKHQQQQRKNSISSTASTVKKSSPLVKKDLYLATIDSEDEDDEDNDDLLDGKNQPVLSKEDKRRRNTAASARFRIKKKLREQALQQTASEMTKKAKAFENRVHELEREVKWLKALIVERKDGQLEQMLTQQHQQHHQQQQQQRQYAPSGGKNVQQHHRGSLSAANGYNMSQHQLRQQQHI